ncbi:hypothetical protein HA48_18055 [Pantoea wallisii]|uniref:Uncharacterized protein n=1 Tax=Pantoea wallisii TaxID=1076551 RepID=A0A1X1D124_9GAMM|nr:hypothetical protein HA48_18055 [Pantoea wallisii]
MSVLIDKVDPVIMFPMLKEQCGIATCLRNLAHKSRDNPAMRKTAVRHSAQHAAQPLQSV